MTTAKPSSQSFDFKSLFKSNDAAVGNISCFNHWHHAGFIAHRINGYSGGAEPGTFHWHYAF